MIDLHQKLNEITCKDDFVFFIESLQDDLKNNPTEWENKTLEDYLDAIGAWTDDMDGYYSNVGIDMPAHIDWKVFATILVAAKMYE
jgi:hypothetical protein